ncbi:MAG: endopeptidase La [Bacteroidales bacterium]|jgi:ATP-dependent Lon protease
MQEKEKNTEQNQTTKENSKEPKHLSDVVLLSEVYPDNIAVLPLQNRPLFPGITLPLIFQGRTMVKLVEDALDNKQSFIGVSYIEQEDTNDFYASKLHETGVLLKIIKIIQKEDEQVHFFAQSLIRFKKVRQCKAHSPLQWQVKYYKDPKDPESDELKAYSLSIISSVKELMQSNQMMKEQMRLSLSQMRYENPGLMMDVIATMLSSEPDKLQELLATYELHKRAEKLLVLLREELEVSQLQKKIQKQIEEKVNKQQKQYFLREQLKAIKQELGLEKDDKTSELEKIKEKLKEAKLTPEVSTVVKEEMEKLQVLEPSSPDYQVTRTYLHTLLDLPWGIFSSQSKDVKTARTILDDQHYGLQDVKDRILEFISTIIKRGKVSGSIICLVGPPGVGKTSIGKSIADALGREFYRFSVGGMRDEAEIKGHRRTYIGAMPGKMIQSLKRTGTSNPVIMLDEIDKIGSSFQGDPASALLEVLDPEQNSQFLDHYLDVRYDFSNILFITTANQLDTIPRPLLNRMEIIKLSGYILEEKMEIAKRYLIPKQRKEHGLKAAEITITETALRKMIDGYAREAGVRSLENAIKKVMRKATLKLAEENLEKVNVSQKNLEVFLGQPYFSNEQPNKQAIPGVTVGLAWTALGGATLDIEASAIPSKSGSFKQTGQLGNVMQESTQIAYSYVRSLVARAKKDADFFDKHFIHLHVPAGATPKDGPSAGITMALALHSLALNKPIKKQLAMTGELTLTGRVLPIGGLREKTIAARRIGFKELIFPHENEKDYKQLPDYIKDGLEVHFVSHFSQVLKIAYSGS